MATVVNTTPTQAEPTGYGFSWIIGLLLLLFVVFLMFYYGLPAMRTAAPSITVPERVDVNVNQNPGGEAPQPQP